MADYIGVIIEESLRDKSVLSDKDLVIVKTKVEKLGKMNKTPWLKQWTVHTVRIQEKNAKRVAEKISKCLDPEHEWYIDLKNDTHSFVIVYNKVLFMNKTSNGQYDRAMEYELLAGSSG